MDPIERMKQEEAALTEQMFGPQSETPEDLPESSTPDNPEAPPASNFESPAPEAIVTIEDDVDDVEEEEVPAKAKRQNWKKRFTGLKDAFDNAQFQSRRRDAQQQQEISYLKTENARLHKVIAELKAGNTDVFGDAISEEDVELIGSEAIDVVKRATQAVSKPLEDKIAQLEAEKLAQVETDAVNAAAEAQDELKRRLMKVVKGFEDIDMNPKFGEYLDDLDEYTGVPRRELFSRAYHSGDVGRIASFYNGFKETLPPTKEEILGKKVTPVGAGGETPNRPTDNKKQRYTIAQYEAIYDAYLKGAYNGAKEKQELEQFMAQLDLAWTEGRIDA